MDCISTQLNASTTQTICSEQASTTNGFYNGDLVNSSFLLLILLALSLIIIIIKTSGIRVKQIYK